MFFQFVKDQIRFYFDFKKGDFLFRRHSNQLPLIFFRPYPQFAKKIFPVPICSNVHAECGPSQPPHQVLENLLNLTLSRPIRGGVKSGKMFLMGWGRSLRAWINSELNLRVIAKRYYVSVLICTHDMSNDG